MSPVTAPRHQAGLRVTRLFTVATLLLIAVGCVVIPYRPESETKHDLAEVPNPELIRLSVAPRRFLQEMGEELVDEEPRIEVLDGQSFIDSAAPAGDLSLAVLLEPATRARIEALRADYLVLLGEPQADTLSDWGGVATWVGFYGLGKQRASSTYWAALIDLRRMKIVEQLSTTATGTDAGVGLFYGIFVVSDTEGSAQKGVIRNLARTLAAAKPEGPLRLVLLAKEPLVTADQHAAMERERKLEQRRTAGGMEPRGIGIDGGALLAGYPAFATPATPGADEVLIVLYRPKTRTGGFYPLAVRADAGTGEVEVTRLLGGGYFPYRVRPGLMRLWVQSDPDEAITLELEAGSTYYVAGDTRMGWSSSHGELVMVDPEKARSEVILCRRLPSTYDYVQDTRKLAEEGYAYKQLELARLYISGVPYAEGESLPRDRVEAYKWYTVVVESRGVVQWMKDSALRDRGILAAEMSVDEIGEGARRGREWLVAFERAFLAAPPEGPSDAQTGDEAPPSEAP